ncbi:MAG: sugar phosphate isomerase/epimerase, partial [Acidobacteria bacterium]|nr:sugar phosphate isomerase/epimerase [Acidobacteriota bacterium]
MAIKYGVNTFIWAASFEASHLPLLEEIRRRGFDGVELPMIEPSKVAAAEIRKGLEENGLEATCCAVLPGGLSLIHEDAEVRRKSRAHMVECIQKTAEVGAKMIAGPLYSPVGYLPGRRRTEDEFARAVESWQMLGGTLAANGVTAAIEPLNRFETYFLNTTADAV